MKRSGEPVAEAMWARRMVQSRLDDTGCVQETCSKCGLITKFDPQLAQKPALRKKDDLMALNDLRMLFSTRLVAIIEQYASHAPHFVEFNKSSYFMVRPCNVVPFDVDNEEHQLNRKSRCDHCGQYETQIGAFPVRLSVSSVRERQFSRTDLEFGSGNNRSPIYIVGRELGQLIRNARITGVNFTEVIGTGP